MATNDANINLNVNTQPALKSLTDLKAEFRSLQAQMSAAGAAGDTELFNKLQKSAGILKNDIKDTSAYMKSLDPGELLSGYVKLAQGMMGAFSVATGAAEMFGATQKSIQEIEKQSMVIIKTMMGLEQLRATFLDGAGKAQLEGLIKTTTLQAKEMALWVAKNPVMAAASVIMTGLVIAIVAMSDAFDGVTEAEKKQAMQSEHNLALYLKLNKEREAIISNGKDEVAEAELLFLSLEKTNKSNADRLDLINTINEKYGTSIQNLKDERQFLDEVNTARTRVINSLISQYTIEANENSIKLWLKEASEYKRTRKIIEEAEQAAWDKNQALISKAYLIKKKYDDLINSGVKQLNAVQLDEYNKTIAYIKLLEDTEKEAQASKKENFAQENYAKNQINKLLQENIVLEKEVIPITEKSTVKIKEKSTAIKDYSDTIQKYLDKQLRPDMFSVPGVEPEVLDSYQQLTKQLSDLETARKAALAVGKDLTPSDLKILDELKKKIDAINKTMADKEVVVAIDEFWGKLIGEDRILAALEGFQRISNGLTEAFSQGFENATIASDNYFNKEYQQLEESKNHKIISEKQYAAKKEALDNERAAKEKELRKKKAEADKISSIFNTTIAIAEATVKAMTAGPVIGQILAGITATLGAIQLGLIVAQPLPAFAKGGIVPGYATGGGVQGYGTDTVPAMLTPGEFVINKQATQNNQQLLSAINSGGEGQLAQMIGEAVSRNMVVVNNVQETSKVQNRITKIHNRAKLR